MELGKWLKPEDGIPTYEEVKGKVVAYVFLAIDIPYIWKIRKRDAYDYIFTQLPLPDYYMILEFPKEVKK